MPPTVLRRELRLALCKSCNFRCFFCHSEGLDRKGKEAKESSESYVSLLRQAALAGYTDITFTGGEPLLYAYKLINILEQMADLPWEGEYPAVTLITNASRVPDEIIKALCAYPGAVKVNVSMHGSDEASFDCATVTQGWFDTVESNIERLTAAGIFVKLNTLCMNGVNSGSDQLRRHLDQAVRLGVSGIKFLELLVTESNRKHYRYFYSDEAICRDLARLGCTISSHDQRTTYLTSPAYPGLGIAVTRCTCKAGCAHCHELRDRQIGSDRRYYPCFIHSNQGIPVAEDEGGFKAALLAGEPRIAEYASEYGDDSPMLVYRDRYVEERRETYWITAQSFQEIQNVLTGQNFVARKIRSFRMVYCLPVHPTEDWLDCRRVLKYGCDSHTPNKFSIIHSDNEYKQNDAGGLTVTVAYRNAAPLLIPAHNETEAEIYLAAHGYRRWFAWDFLVHDFEHSDSGMKIAVDESGKTHTLRVDPAEMDHATIQTALATLLATPMNIQHTLFRAMETTAGR